MRSRYVLGGILVSTLLSVAAFAQSTAPTPSRTPAVSATIAETMTRISQWRASKLVGVNVYNTKNEKLGDINEILLDKSGRVSGVVIGVGGFLGMGERDILVGLDQLKFVNEPLVGHHRVRFHDYSAAFTCSQRAVVSGSRGNGREQGSAEDHVAIQI